MMKAVSFMYVRPPGYNAESAKAAEVADERMKLDQNNASRDTTSTAIVTDTKPDKNLSGGDKKARPKDVFGRALPTEEEFEVLKNAPRLETGMPARVKPFGVEIRNVRCVRCGTFGHQSGDRECPLKDVIMPNEESRLKRDDPLTAIMAQTDSSEPLKWELKQKPGLSPPRGGFQPDDPNQQIVAEEIFDEYGGFLSGGDIPALLSNFSTKKPKKHSKQKSRHKHHSSSGTQSEPKHHRADHSSSSDSEVDRQRKRRAKSKHKKNKRCHSESGRSNRNRSSLSGSDDDRERMRKAKSTQKRKKRCHSESSRSDASDREHRGNRSSSSDAEDDRERKRSIRREHKHKKRYHSESSRSDFADQEHHGNRSYSSDSEDDKERKRSKHSHKKRHNLESSRYDRSHSELHGSRSSSDSEADRERKKRAKGKHKVRENRHFDSSDSDRRHHHRWK